MAFNTSVKTQSDEKDLTKEQAEEYVKCFSDPVYFIRNYVKVQNIKTGAMLFEMRSYHDKIFDGVHNNNRVCILQPRQTGKTSAIVAYLLWFAIFNPDKTVGVASNKGSGAKEIIARVKYAYESLPVWMKPVVLSYNVFDVSFDNGSKIMSATTTENTFRGFSLNLLFLDEFHFVKPKIADEFWTSILPTLTSEGHNAAKLIITSTPNGSEGKFAEIWFGAMNEQNGFKAIEVKNSEVEGRDEKFKEEMLKSMSLNKYLQEFENAFISDKGTLVDSVVLEALSHSEAFSRLSNGKVWGSPKNRRIGLSVDVGEGIGKDYTVIEGFDIDTLEQVIEWRDNKMTISKFTSFFIDFMNELIKNQGVKELYYTVESNPIGLSVINLIENSNHPILDTAIMVSESGRKRKGILTTNKSKMKGCMKFKDLVEKGRMKLNSKNLLSELKFFVQAGASFRAEVGMTDDLVMATIIFVNMLDELTRFDEVVYDRMKTLYDDMDDDGIAEPMGIVF